MIRAFLKPLRTKNKKGIRDSRNEILPQKNRSIIKQSTHKDISKSYARVFSTVEGQRVLDHLQLTTLYRAQSPDTPDAQIRHQEGQRFVVFQILRQVERGRSGS